MAVDLNARALVGTAAICTWNDIDPGARADFYAWHVREHVPERLGVPGFRRGRRYVADVGDRSPEFFTLYETESLAVLTSAAYLERLNNPTAWTRRAAGAFRGTIRAATTVVQSLGAGSGGYLATLRVGMLGDESAPFDIRLMASVLAEALDLPRVTGVHLCMTDAAASGVKSLESRTRVGDLPIPAGVFLAEGCDGAAVAAAAAVMERGFRAATPTRQQIDIFRLEFMLG